MVFKSDPLEFADSMRPPLKRPVACHAADVAMLECSDLKPDEPLLKKILRRFPVLYQFAGFDSIFGFSAFISLSSSGEI